MKIKKKQEWNLEVTGKFFAPALQLFSYSEILLSEQHFLRNL